MAFQNYSWLLGVLMPLSLLIIFRASTTAGAPLELALPNCPDHCGDVPIPYPFGLRKDCYMNHKFFINCNSDQIAYLMNSSIRVTNISLPESELQISQYVARDCYNNKGNQSSNTNSTLTVPPPFTISSTKNKFVAVGCDTIALVDGYQGEDEFLTGCVSFCIRLQSVDQGSCSGGGCCQTDIPHGLKNSTVMLGSVYNHTNVFHFNPCSYAFIVQEGQFKFSNASFKLLANTQLLPMMLNWEIGNQSCDAARKNRQKFLCKANTTKCVHSIDGSGYLCQCKGGYEGNPYHPNGCQDIDECKNKSSCVNGECENLPGDYSCNCLQGFKNNGTNAKICIRGDSKNQSKIVRVLIISLGVSAGFLVLIVGISSTYYGMQRRKLMKLKEKNFKENGGLLLQEQLASHGGSVETLKIFTAEGLAQATNNYHESGILGEGGYGTVYRGVLPDKKVVAIKKSKISAQSESHQFVNEVIVLSQINHRNVVKLLGCCLETEMPELVYEFITNGTLYEHIHKKKSSLTLELRMKIAAETAGALAYLHSSASTPIIHRDVKASNILLDENYMAKVSDFGASRLVALGETQIATLVLGTLGYLDPEYLQSNMLTEKSDVYSFGVVLVELLTSKVPLSKDGRCLASVFISCMDEDCLAQILDNEIANDEGSIEILKQVASLARRCLRVKGEERPSMKEVATELEGMRVAANHPWGKNSVGFNSEETECLLGSPADSRAYVVNVRGEGEGDGRGDLSIGTSIGYESMQVQMLMPYDDGR